MKEFQHLYPTRNTQQCFLEEKTQDRTLSLTHKPHQNRTPHLRTHTRNNSMHTALNYLCRVYGTHTHNAHLVNGNSLFPMACLFKGGGCYLTFLSPPNPPLSPSPSPASLTASSWWSPLSLFPAPCFIIPSPCWPFSVSHLCSSRGCACTFSYGFLKAFLVSVRFSGEPISHLSSLSCLWAEAVQGCWPVMCCLSLQWLNRHACFFLFCFHRYILGILWLYWTELVTGCQEMNGQGGVMQKWQ